MQLERGEPLEPLIGELVELDLERPLQTLRRCEISDFARVADADLLVGLPIRREIALHPREFDAKQVALGFAPIALVSRRGRIGPRRAKTGPRWRLHGLIFLGRNLQMN